ncbi:hypothetical protein EON81_23225 [bacterium]|nr:MAG: hypothetical protein EON81_23225 [bacterium]
MALFFSGKTTCPLCGKMIEEGDAMVAFSAFLRSEHRLGRFSDAAFHESCFRASPEGAEAEALYAEWNAIWDARPRGVPWAEAEAWGKKANALFDEIAERADLPKPRTSDL